MFLRHQMTVCFMVYLSHNPLTHHTHTHTHTHTHKPSIHQVVHPKSDAQRRRLVESVKNIFLFKSLDNVRHSTLTLHLFSTLRVFVFVCVCVCVCVQEQTNEVLDAMFEKKVSVSCPLLLFYHTHYIFLDLSLCLQVNKNDKVIVQGDDGDNFYVVDRYTHPHTHPHVAHTHIHTEALNCPRNVKLLF